jgi:hypothetical protein
MTAVARAKKAVAAADDREKKAKTARRAHEMRLSGMSWWDIAEALRMPEAQAKAAVSERIAAASEVVDYYEKREFLQIELDRLDALQSAVWADAMDGKVPAVQTALAIMDRRAKWLGFSEPQAQQSVTSNTIIVPGNTKDYIAALQQVRSEIEAA